MPIRVLVVDDSGFFRRGLKAMLNNDARLEVIGEAINGAEAIEMSAKLKPNVIIMDVEMPVMDGMEATRLIREFDKNVKIIAFTANVTNEQIESYLANGFDDIITKPVNIDQLLNKIR